MTHFLVDGSHISVDLQDLSAVAVPHWHVPTPAVLTTQFCPFLKFKHDGLSPHLHTLWKVSHFSFVGHAVGHSTVHCGFPLASFVQTDPSLQVPEKTFVMYPYIVHRHTYNIYMTLIMSVFASYIHYLGLRMSMKELSPF